MKLKLWNQLVDAGFNFAGSTSDETALPEIRRDYLAKGYSEVEFTYLRGDKRRFAYFTKHPQINP